MIDARNLGLIGFLYKETTVVQFYTQDKLNRWRLVNYKYPGKPRRWMRYYSNIKTA